MRLAFIYGLWSSSGHGKFDIPNLWHARGLTGSESSFFNNVLGLGALGNQVDVFCDIVERVERDGVNFYPAATPCGIDYDAYIVWNEPNVLKSLHGKVKGKLIVDQQLNDFGYCDKGFEQWMDYFVFPADVHRRFMVDYCKTDLGIDIKKKSTTIAQPTNLSLFAGTEERDPYRLMYCSSPDRGLHHVFEMFLEVRKQIPQVTLHIYYEIQRWFDSLCGYWSEYDRNVKPHPDLVRLAERARYVKDCISRLGGNGENGVWVHGNVSNAELARDMKKSSLLIYPCDPVRFTEGFSVSTLDSCAAGMIPLITPVDALGDVYKDSGAEIIPGDVSENQNLWQEKILNLLKEDNQARREKCVSFASGFSREAIAKKWQSFLKEVCS